VLESEWTYLGARNRQEAYTHHHAGNRDLAITKLDAVEIEDRQTVRRDQAVQCKNLVHLDSSHKRASSLADDVRDRDDICEFGREGSSD
jgi:hypothetical protein